MGDQHTIKMVKVFCNKLNHTDEYIRRLCLNPKCAESSTLCSECLVYNHLGCRQQVLKFEEIPQQLIELQQLRLAIKALEEKINQQFKKLLDQIEYILQPISKYQQTPNLTNLNEIGQLLRRNPGQKILHTIDETKTQIRCLLENHNCQQGFNQFLETIQKQQVTRQENERQESQLIEKESQNIWQNNSENVQEIEIRNYKIIYHLRQLYTQLNQYKSFNDPTYQQIISTMKNEMQIKDPTYQQIISTMKNEMQIKDPTYQQIISTMKNEMQIKDLIPIFEKIQNLFNQNSEMFKLFDRIIKDILRKNSTINLKDIDRERIKNSEMIQLYNYINNLEQGVENKEQQSIEQITQNKLNDLENEQQHKNQKIIEDLKLLLKQFNYSKFSDRSLSQIIESMKKNVQTRDLILIFQKLQTIFGRTSEMSKLFDRIIQGISNQYSRINLSGIQKSYILANEIQQLQDYIYDLKQQYYKIELQ